MIRNESGFIDVEIKKGDFEKLKDLLNKGFISQSVYEYLLLKVSEKDNVLRLVRKGWETDCAFEEDS